MFSDSAPGQHNQQSSKSESSFRLRIKAFCLILALSTSTFAFAQGKVEKPSSPSGIAARLGLKPGDLTPKEATTTYRDNPIVDGDGGDDLSVAERQDNLRQSTSGVSDMVGTFSVQNFQGTQATLYNTHASADGFRNYFTTWYTPNFAYKDAGVQVWAYHDKPSSDNYDLWTSGGTDYGIDAVRACFHSGHGGMAATNVFFAPMGGNWGGRGWNAVSNQMFLGGNNYSYGDERLRYMFWDTCNSVMVSGGHDPYSTWGTRSKGVRMVFGYETTSIDSPNYGKFFWEEWNKGKTLAQAFLDASWRINTGQSPSVVAFGVNQSDAVYRLNNERYLYSGAAGNGWGQWRWYGARSAASAVASLSAFASSLDGQDQVMVHKVAPKGNSTDEITGLARALGINLDDSSRIQERPFGLRAVQANGATLLIEQNGNFELIIEKADAPEASGAEMSDEALVNRAQEIAGQLSLMNGLGLRVGLIRDLNENGGVEGFQGAPRVVEKTVILDQMIDGVPFIDPEAGHLEITFDARTGQAKRLRSTMQAIEFGATDRAKDSLGQGKAVRLSLDEARAAALKAFAQPGSLTSAQKLEIVPGTEAVGYQLIDGKVVPVFRAEIKNPGDSFGRPQLAVIPLVKVD